MAFWIPGGYDEEMNKKIINFLKPVLGILLIVFLFSKVGLSDIIYLILSIKVEYLILAIICFIINLLMGSWRLKMLMDSLKKTVSFWDVTKYSLASYGLGQISPGRVGEFLFVYFLKKRGFSLAEGFAISLYDKALTFGFLVLASTVGILLIFKTYAALIYVVLLVLLMFVASFFIYSKKGRSFIAKYIMRRYAKKFSGFGKAMNFYLKKKKLVLFFSFIIIIFKWIINSAILFFLFYAFEIYINIFLVLFISSIAILISLIPISLAGLGIRGYSAVYLFEQIGIQDNITLSVYTVLLLMKYIAAFLSIIFFYDRKLAR